jgi:hypothetical protein
MQCKKEQMAFLLDASFGRNRLQGKGDGGGCRKQIFHHGMVFLDNHLRPRPLDTAIITVQQIVLQSNAPEKTRQSRGMLNRSFR